MSDFPDTIYEPRTLENLPSIEFDAFQTQNLFAEDYNELAQEVVAIEEFIEESYTGDITVQTSEDPTFSVLHFEKGILKSVT